MAVDRVLVAAAVANGGSPVSVARGRDYRDAGLPGALYRLAERVGFLRSQEVGGEGEADPPDVRDSLQLDRPVEGPNDGRIGVPAGIVEHTEVDQVGPGRHPPLAWAPMAGITNWVLADTSRSGRHTL